jgi:ribosomal protein L16 Arg81 hydroxylase
MRFDELIAPVTAERFTSEFYGRKPLHVPDAPESKRAKLIDWPRLNALLAIRSHWTEANIKLLMNSRAVAPDFYMREAETIGGRSRRADLAKVDLFLAMGASLVANSVEDISPEIRSVTSDLGDRFSARTGANIYCSFQDVQAFASHCDLHEVFAVQCEGEKTWNIYENRAVAPVEMLNSPDAQAMIDAAKGRLRHQVRMRPGDLLYIPRGFYHDALASNGASLHVTFSVTPLTGRILFQLLEEAAVQDSDFRQYLPDAREQGSGALNAHLAGLAEKIARLITSGAFMAAVATRQRQLWEPDHPSQLPTRQRLDFYARTDRHVELQPHPEGPRLVLGGESTALGFSGAPAEWLLGRPAFSLQELFANFPYIEQERLVELVRTMERIQAIYPYTPEL